jgi:hypothetical protein
MRVQSGRRERSLTGEVAGEDGAVVVGADFENIRGSIGYKRKEEGSRKSFASSAFYE